MPRQVPKDRRKGSLLKLEPLENRAIPAGLTFDAAAVGSGSLPWAAHQILPGSFVAESATVLIPRACVELIGVPDGGNYVMRPVQQPAPPASDQGLLPPAAVQRLGWEVFRSELPRLLREVPGKWAAYRGEQQVALRDSKQEVYAQLTRAGVPLDEVVVVRVEHLAPPVDLRRIRRVVSTWTRSASASPPGVPDEPAP